MGSFVQILFSLAFFIVNTIFWSLLIFLLVPVKFFTLGRWRKQVSLVMATLAENWITCNSKGLDWTKSITWDVQGLETLNKNSSYLVIANHQSWADITVLQYVFNRRIPFLRFFLKRQLFYVPILGLAWWALDFPFMNRYSKEYLAKYPEKRGADAAVTREACERFRGLPVSIINFAEGTRYSPEKQPAQSTYQNLLPPKAGGLAFVLEAMGNQFSALLDVTIFYPQGRVSFWCLIGNRLKSVVVRVKTRSIPQKILIGNYSEDSRSREDAQQWVHSIWQEKDALLGQLKKL